MQTSIPVQIALLLVVTESPASAITIDNFEEGPFSVSESNSVQCHEPLPGVIFCGDTQSGLSTLNVISGQRGVSLQAGATADLALTAGDDSAVVSAPTSSVFFIYQFDSPFDLTQGGTLDRFVVDITAASGTAELGFNVLNGSSAFSLPAGSDAAITGPGTITVLFSDFIQVAGPPAVLDLTQVDQVSFATTYPDGSGSVSVSNIAAIPEPGTGLLVSFGVLAVAAGRRRPHGRSCCR